jgi:glycylpeptide N-tetradecanoyltransferase
MAEDKQPTEKDLKNLVEKVDKLVSSKKVKQLIKNPSTANGSTSNADSEAKMKAQLQQMMESMALLERAGKIKTVGKKDVGDHKFWNTQPVPSHGNMKHYFVIYHQISNCIN